jgi:hypothetical protein
MTNDDYYHAGQSKEFTDRLAKMMEAKRTTAQQPKPKKPFLSPAQEAHKRGLLIFTIIAIAIAASILALGLKALYLDEFLLIFGGTLIIRSKLKKAGLLPSMQMVCPHCNAKGSVITSRVRQKQGIGGGKATAAILTGGVSMLGTGLSRKQTVTKAHCTNCMARWTF